MLELRNIKKVYPAGNGEVVALKGVNLLFRRSEFVSILGPSGCGKTTMLNIIGGLDGYTQGDLIINGRSTRQYRDRDWDTYRNHSIGFVFQNYNLIPHQTVLQNVELALTLSGVSKTERRQRAKEALEKVGLGDQLNKRPNEMSGGQMQRVAIARALVNNPDIILADEPTGALDTETSVQVMEILKEISNDRLIIMVTHNPDLANKYSTRIINMLDGQITNDSAPLTAEEAEELQKEQVNKETSEKQVRKKGNKPTMSFGTSFMLSLKNLFTKKGRTILTSFAGSIGIIGIALILSVSQGTTAYIDSVQESTLASYPITLEAKSVDLGSLMQTFMTVTDKEIDHPNDAVYKKTALFDIINAMSNVETNENDLRSFKTYLESEMKKTDGNLSEAVSGIQYSYGLDLQVLTENVDGEIIISDAQKMIQGLILEHMQIDMSSLMGTSSTQDMMAMNPMMSGMTTGVWNEILPAKDGSPVNPLMHEQYEMVYGAWPTSYNEVVLVLDENNELDDVTLYALGLLPKSDIDALTQAALDPKKTVTQTVTKWTYEEICAREYHTVFNGDCYRKDDATGLYIDLRNNKEELRYLFSEKAIPLKISGIIRQTDSSSNGLIRNGIGYTHLLTKHLVERSKNSQIIADQKANPNLDILTGLPFKTSTTTLSKEEKQTAFIEFTSALNEMKKLEVYQKILATLPEEQLAAMTQEELSKYSIDQIRGMLLQSIQETLTLSEADAKAYVDAMNDEKATEYFAAGIRSSILAGAQQQAEAYMQSKAPQVLLQEFNALLTAYTAEQCAKYYDEIITFSTTDFDKNLLSMGYIDLASPTKINLYASSFENKDVIENTITTYNSQVDEVKQIEYTDYIGLLLSSVTTIIDAITYVLIAFVSISLIVSSIMIGVITLISVQERTKEIGILRAIGASKRNVSGMFNAETMIVGFASGLLGVIVTYLLCIPINLILYHLTGLDNLQAYLPIPAAIVLVVISVLLTLISGIIPSRSAAKKDPVEALRTE